MRGGNFWSVTRLVTMADNLNYQPVHRRQRQSRSATPQEQIAYHLHAAVSAGPGSDDARAAGQKALSHLLQALEQVVPELKMGRISQTPVEQRAKWIEVLRVLVGSEMLPDLKELTIALVELDRGAPHPALATAAGGRQGGLSTTDDLQLMSFAVEAADELKSRCSCTEEYRAELKESDTSHSTVEGYRKRVLNGPVELHPRPNYDLNWWEAPEIVLQRVVWKLRKQRKKRSSVPVVET